MLVEVEMVFVLLYLIVDVCWWVVCLEGCEVCFV